MIGEALRWMFKPDAPFYVRPRWDPALARWLLAFSRRCNLDDWLRTGAAKARVLRRSRALIEALVREQQLDCEFRSEEHTSELQSLMRISYAVFCLKKTKHIT